MAFRYRVVVLLYVLVLLPAVWVGGGNGPFNWNQFWITELVVGTVLATLWLLVCWVAIGGRAIQRY